MINQTTIGNNHEAWQMENTREINGESILRELTIYALTDAGMNNTSFWCRNCSVEFNPEEENVRRESELSVPNRNIEPAVSTTPGIPDISIRHEPEIKGGLKALQQKGLKITDYKENIPRPRKR